MCRTVHALLQTVICGIQMLVRVFMTVILMLENLIRMILQTMYNFISFLLQMLSLIPICIVFLVTARLKCFMCGGGGPCPVNRGGACDCIMSAVAIIIMFFIFRATGVLDKIFYSLGYTKARPQVYRFVPTPGEITECSRNDTEYTESTTLTLTLNTHALFETELITETEMLTEMLTEIYNYPQDLTSNIIQYILTTTIESDSATTKITNAPQNDPNALGRFAQEDYDQDVKGFPHIVPPNAG